MPLKAVLDGQSVYAFRYTHTEWISLKGTYKERQLKAACCGEKVAPRTSASGTQHFYHLKKSNCSYKPESKEHLLVKSKIASAASDEGWIAKTEEDGQDNDGNKWSADVYCTNGTKRLIFEVQLSPQTWKETEQRQMRYKNSGLSAIWLVPRRSHLANLTDKDLPMFSVNITKKMEIYIQLARSTWVPLQDFVTRVLAGGLSWRNTRTVQKNVDFICYFQESSCAYCGKQNELLMAVKQCSNNESSRLIHDHRELMALLNAIPRNRDAFFCIKKAATSDAWQQLCAHCDAVLHQSSRDSPKRYLSTGLSREELSGHSTERFNCQIEIDIPTRGGYWVLLDSAGVARME